MNKYKEGIPMKKLVAFIGISSLFILSVATVQGEETSKEKEQKGLSMKHLTMDEIVVTDAAITDSTVNVIGSKTVEKGKNTNIPDVLENEAGIDINRKALVGDTGDTLKIRGLSGNRIMMNIDGRPINAAGVQGGYFIDFSTIPIDNIERIEVMYGGSSVKYGNNAGGGVINVITKKPTENPTFAFYGNYGDVSNIQNYRLNHTYKIGPVGYSIAGSYQRASEYLWNNDYEAKNIGGKFYIDMPLKGELTLGVQYTDVSRGFAIQNRLSTNPDNPNFYVKRNPDAPLSLGESFSPGAGNLTSPGPGARWDKTKYLLDLSYLQPIGDATVEFKHYQNHEDRDEKNYSAHWLNAAYPDGRLILDRTVKSDRSDGQSLEFLMPIKGHGIDAGIERKVISTGGQKVHYVDNTYAPGRTVTDSDGSSSYMWGYYLQDSWSITDNFLLTPGIRYDTYKGPVYDSGEDQLEDDGLSLSLTGTYRFTENDALTASLYRKYLTPSAPDAAWWSDGYGLYYTTPLKLERNNAAEMAYQHNFSPKDSIRVAAYYYGIDDYVSRFSRPDGRGCYNIKKVELIGASIEGSAQIFPWMSARGNVTYQHSKKMGDSQDPSQLSDKLDYLPEWKGNLVLDFKLPYNSTFSIKERVVGISETVYSYTVSGPGGGTRYKLMKLSPFSTTDIEIKAPVTKYGEIAFFVENLFNENYEERFGYALPGRIIGASAKIVF
jgi:outer membrane receptor protein involved in Fe transport